VTLTIATLLAAFLCLIPGIRFLLYRPENREKSLSALRDPKITLALLILAGAWFLWEILQLGAADFGNYKHLLFIFFLLLAIGAWFYLRDFLAVRAASVLVLLVAHTLLNAAFGYYELPARLILVSGCYAAVVLALYFGSLPYRFRDLLEWLYMNPQKPRFLGGFFILYALILFITALSYQL